MLPVRYDLSTRGVDPELFPFRTWARLQKELLYSSPQLLTHGDAQGAPALRQALAEYLSEYRGVQCGPHQIVVGAGLEYLLGLLAPLLPGPAAVETPGYPRALQVLQNNGVHCCCLPVDEDGLSVEALNRSDAAVCYVTPSHQFPTGVTMPAGRRAELLHWAARRPGGRYIIEDDYDSEFRFDTRPLPSLQGMAGADGPVVYLSTCSRSLAPSIRIAYMVLPEHLLPAWRKKYRLYSGTVSRFEQQTLARFITEGYFTRHLARERVAYKARRDALAAALNTAFAPGELTLADFLDITDQLLKCGADIVEINTIRKHLSAVKGGKFAKLCAPAQVYCIALSDILGDRPDSIASGPACADASTAAEAFAISEKYNLKLTEEMRKQLAMETPKTLANVTMEITGSVTQLCADAARAAEQLGYTPLVLTNMLDCEAREAGRFLASIAKTIRKDGLPLSSPCAILCGGETVVHITGKGKGGRNQELALAAAERIAGMEGIVIAAAGSDGTDGPTDAAGGIVDGKTCGILAEKGISIPAVLAENDSNAALAAADALLITGATGTNVNDIYLLLCQ